MRVPEFRYMRWAKVHGGAARHDLTVSAAPPLPLPPLTGAHDHRLLPCGDGDPVIEGLVAAHCGVPAEHVLFVPGSTLGNFLLAATQIEPGDTVLVETPAYENLPNLVTLLGGRLRPLPRRAEDGWRPDLAALAEGLEEGASLVLLTDLHNPSGARLDPADLAAVRNLAAHHGATVLLDEVYRDFLPGPAGTAYEPDDPTVLVATSLTKVYGLGGLRAGWVLLPPDRREDAARLLDYLTVIPPHPVATAAEIALRSIEERRDHARAFTAPGRLLFTRWIEGRDDIHCVAPEAGVVCYPRLKAVSDTEPLCRWLMRDRDTGIVPGRFFGHPDRVRIACGAAPEVLEEALPHLAAALDRFGD